MKKNTSKNVGLLVTIMMITVAFLAAVVPIQADSSVIEFTKKVWDAHNEEWADVIAADVGETVLFNITLEYTGDLNLFNISVKDELPESLQFVPGSATFVKHMTTDPSEEIIGNSIYWNFTVNDEFDLVLDAVNTSMSIEFQATVIQYNERAINNASVSATEAGEHNVNKQTSASVVPPLAVIKEVRTNGEWSDHAEATRDDLVQFRITIINHESFPIKNMIVNDTLNGMSLEYKSDSTEISTIGNGVAVDDEPTIIVSPDNKSITWQWLDEQIYIPGGADNGIRIIFLANVVASESEETVVNLVNVTAWGIESDLKIYGEDTASVDILPPAPQFEKKVQNGGSWAEETSAILGGTVRFRLQCTYYGDANLSDIKMVDMLPDFLDYAGDVTKTGQGTVNVSENNRTIWVNFTNLIEDGEHVAVEFNALVTGEELDEGLNNAIVTATHNTNPETDYLAVDNASVSIIENQPPYYPLLEGDLSGEVGELLSFEVYAVDPEGHDIRFKFDWDNAVGGWSDLKADDTWHTFTHSWSSAGTYTVKAKAKDQHGAESDRWSNSITVEITGDDDDTPPEEGDSNITIKEIKGGFGVSATIKNTGVEGAHGVNWELKVQGKRIGSLLDVKDNGTTNLSAGDDIVVELSERLFGLGRIEITAKAKVPGEPEVKETVDAFIIGLIVLIPQ